MKKETYSFNKKTDLWPLIGPFIYQERNWRDAREKGTPPTPQKKYYLTSIGVLAWGFGLPLIVLKGLEKLCA